MLMVIDKSLSLERQLRLGHDIVQLGKGVAGVDGEGWVHKGVITDFL